MGVNKYYYIAVDLHAVRLIHYEICTHWAITPS